MASAGGEIENYHLPAGSLSEESFSIIPAAEHRREKVDKLSGEIRERETSFLLICQSPLRLNLSVVSGYRVIRSVLISLHIISQ